MIKLGIRIRLRMVIKDYKAKRRARRVRSYWEWVSSRKSYLLAPRIP